MLNFEIRKKYFTILAKKISDVYEIITGIPPLSLPNSKGKNLKSYSISGNVDEEIIEYSDGTAIEGKPNLLRTLGRTEQAVSGSTSTKRILFGDKWAKLTANNDIGTPTNVVIGEGSTSFSAPANGYGIGFPVKLKPNHSYTVYSDVATSDSEVKMDLRISFYAADGTWLSWQYSNAASSGKVLKSFAVPSNADMTVILCAKSTGTSANTPTLTFSNIMLVEGVYTATNAPAYTPYKQLLTDYNGVGDKTKNLFDKTKVTAGYWLNYNTGIPEISTSNYCISDHIPVKAGKTYTMTNPQTSRRWLYDSNKNPLNRINSLPFTPSQDGYVVTTIYTLTVPLDTFQIEESSTVTDYEPYGYKIPVLSGSQNIQPTQNNIFINNSLFKTGENVDTVNYPQNKTVKAVGKYVFTGNENIELYDNSKGFRFALSDMETGNCLDGFCNRFENFKNVTENDVQKVFFGYNNNYVYFRRVTSTSVTKADMQAILANWYSSGKPLTIWYPLEEEVKEAVTLPDVPTVQGNATIMIDTEVQPSEMSVEYAVEGA